MLQGILLHILIGANLGLLVAFVFEGNSSGNKKYFLLLTGMLAAIFPDFLKYFGNIIGHSLIFVPVMSLPASFLFYFLTRKIFSFLKIWIFHTLIVIIGHLMIDFFSHDIQLFFPVSTSNYTFNILQRNELFILTISCVNILLFFMLRKILKVKKISHITHRLGLLLIIFYIIFKGLSYNFLVNKLENQYYDLKPLKITVFPGGYNFLGMSNWKFIISSTQFFVNGGALLTGENSQKPSMTYLSKTGQYDIIGEKKLEGKKIYILKNKEGMYKTISYQNGKWVELEFEDTSVMENILIPSYEST